MIAYHLGDGEIIPLASSATSADKITFTDTLGIDADNVQTAIEKVKTVLEDQFGLDITAIYNAIVAKGVVPTSKAVDDLVYAIYQITTEVKHTGVYNAVSRNTYDNDMGSQHTFRYVNTLAVPNSNTETYNFEDPSVGETVDLGETNIIRYVNAESVYAKGYEEGQNNIRETVSTYLIKFTGAMGRYFTQSFTIPEDVTGFAVSGACGVRLISQGQPNVHDVIMRCDVIYPKQPDGRRRVQNLYYYDGSLDTSPGEGDLVIETGGGDGYVVEVSFDIRKLKSDGYKDGYKAAFSTAFITMWK